MSAPNLCEVMRQFRWASRIELKAAAQMIGVSETTLARFERGEGTSGETLAKVLRWLLADARAQEQTELQIMTSAAIDRVAELLNGTGDDDDERPF